MNVTVNSAPTAGPLTRRLTARGLVSLAQPQRSELDRLLAVHAVVSAPARRLAA